MKKKELYKLVKEQLRIALKEEAFKIRNNKKNQAILDKRFEIGNKKQKLLKEQNEKQNEDFLQDVYNFLLTSYENGVPIETVLESTFLTNFNIDFITEIYTSGLITTLSFNDFINLAGIETIIYSWDDATGCATNFAVPTGPITIYEDGNCGITHEINDSFVCCGSNNGNTYDHAEHGTIDPFTFGGTSFNGLNSGAVTGGGSNPANGAPWNNPSCYCPNPVLNGNNELTSCFPAGYNLTYADFNAWLASNAISNAFGTVSLADFNGANGGGCAGCAHADSITYGDNPWAGGTGGTLGCPTDGSLNETAWNGNLSVDNLGCCQFLGCNEDGASTPAGGPTALSTWTLSVGTLGTITANTSDNWFTNDGSCEFTGCPGVTLPITLNGITTNYSAPSTPITGLVNTVAGNTWNDDGSCVVDGCTDASIVFTDSYTGLDYPNNYIAPTANYTVTQTNAVCTIVACIDPTDQGGDINLNYVDPSTWPTTWTIINTGCISSNGLVGGCTDPDASNYNALADYDDGSCEYLGCTDPAAYNYNVNALTDDGSCLFPGCTLGSIYGAQGLNDPPGAPDFDSGANVDDGTCEITACDDPTALNYFCDLSEPNPNFTNNINFADFCDANGPIEAPSTPGVPSPSPTLALFTPAPSGHPMECQYAQGCTDPLANNYDPNALTDDGLCEWNYCGDSAAYNYNPNQPIVATGPNAGQTIAFTSGNNTLDPSKCEYLGCALPDNGSLLSVPGTQGQDNGYHVNNDGCVPGSPQGFTTSPYTGANSIEFSGDLVSSDSSCCQFEGCYNLGTDEYIQSVGGNLLYPTPGNYDASANVDDGSCEYYGCADENASNYFCIYNPSLCGGSQGGSIDGNIGTLTDDGTCEYNHCADVEAGRCSNPSNNPNVTQPTISIQCLTIGGTLPDTIINNQFSATFTPPTRPDDNTLSEQIAASGCWKVTSVVPSQIGTQWDRPACTCDPEITYDCCTFPTCPGSFTWWLNNEFPGWQSTYPNYPPPKPNMSLKFCMPRFDGSGQYPSESACENICDLTRTPRDLGMSPIDPPLNTLTKSGEELDIPELSESKKLRKLIKQWRKKNL